MQQQTGLFVESLVQIAELLLFDLNSFCDENLCIFLITLASYF